MAHRGGVAEVWLWGARIGAVSWDPEQQLGVFEYTPDFQRSGIQLAPLTMPLGPRIHEFPGLSRDTFHGLPGLLADSLPDRFGNRLIDSWLVRSGRAAADFSPVDRLLYIGTRAMGALEFHPAQGKGEGSVPLDLAELVALANEVLVQRQGFRASIGVEGDERQEAMNSILQVGVSAGGARAKAIIAWNPETDEVRSGQVRAPHGFGYWLLKFDGVEENRDRETLADPLGFGLIEYAYSLMAGAAGINMSECRLLHEGGRHHFMSRRFDRTGGGGKVHMQSLCAMAHLDFNQAGAHSYEQALQVIQRLGLGKQALEQQLRRAAFNVAARNQDDHTKNIAFLMDRKGRWALSPAYDITLAYNPEGQWTNRHQMSLNGKREGITRDDLLALSNRFQITRPRAEALLDEVAHAVSRWPEFAERAGVDSDQIPTISAVHRDLGSAHG